jgi:hypothetical protein
VPPPAPNRACASASAPPGHVARIGLKFKVAMTTRLMTF